MFRNSDVQMDLLDTDSSEGLIKIKAPSRYSGWDSQEGLCKQRSFLLCVTDDRIEEVSISKYLESIMIRWIWSI